MIWQQPAPGGYPDPAMIGLSGMERLRAGRERRMPQAPIGYLTEVLFRELSKGHVGFEMPASPWFANSAGVIPGGMLTVLADAGFGAPIHSMLPPGVSFTTAELSLTMLRPAHPDPEAKITASGQVIHLGRSIALSEAFLYHEGSEEMIAHGTSRCTVFPPLDPIPDPPAELPVLDFPFPGENPEHPLNRPVEGQVLPEETFERMSGLEIMRAQIAGEISPPPPIHFLTGIRVVEADEGYAKVVLPCSPWLSTSMGTVQGGFTAMLADFALTSAAFTTTPAGTAVAPLDFKVNFLRPVAPDMRDLTAEARIEHRGRTISIASARITNADGKPVALATGSSMYLPGRPASLAGVEQLGSGSEDPEDEPGA